MVPPSPHTPSSRRQGIALVIVLSFVVLLSVLVLAFLGSVTEDLGASSSFAASSDVKQRAQTAVNLVIGQIQAATSQPDVAWASQPGMIRTYTRSGAKGSQYKLYSSDNMVVADFAVANATGQPTDVPADWANRPDQFTDLNQPVLAPNPAGPITTAGSSKTFTAQYPILNPAALGSDIKGFSAKSLAGDNVVAPDPAANPLTTGNPLPMPVQWLYMLRNGELRPIRNGIISGATKENPPVARIAFWTDDETAKININTAGGDEWDADSSVPASYSDAPMMSHPFEGKLTGNQPVNHEYQRYPGHPATTYLSAVFPDLGRGELYSITPRVTNLLGSADVSSQGGTRTTNYGVGAAASARPTALPLSKGLPLYASLDELRFKRSITARETQEDAAGNLLLTVDQIEQAKFFLTMQSRAPEVTMFNTPRIGIWPLWGDATKRTPYDRTIAFASTIAGQPFYFVRENPNSSTFDYEKFPRNGQLYNYLLDLTSRAIPGYGASFQAKYPADRDQILTEVFDYIRSCINLVDTSTGATPYTGSKTWDESRRAVRGTGHVAPIKINDTRGFGRTMTLYSPILQVYAKETVIHPDDLKYDTNNDGTIKKPENSFASRLKTTRVQCVLLINSFCAAQGVVRLVPDLVYEIDGLQTIKIQGQSANFPSKARVNFNRNTPNDDYARGGATGTAGLFWEAGAATFKPLGQTGPDKEYPFYSDEITVDSEVRSPLTLSSGTITLRILAKGGDEVLQTLQFSYPETKIPTPYVAGSYMFKYVDGAKFPQLKKGTASTFYSGTQPDATTLTNNFFQGVTAERQFMNQVTRSLVPMGNRVRGDLRLLTATENVTADSFVGADGYYTPEADFTTANPSQHRYHMPYDNRKRDGQTGGAMLVGAPRADAAGGHITGFGGNLVEGIKYQQHDSEVQSNATAAPYTFYPEASLTEPDGSPRINAALLEGANGARLPGDWDTGIASTPDGPFINKADEGEVGGQAYSAYNATMAAGTLFSPNRQVPSPAIFGSLSTGVKAQKPWQTLLFCPNPAAGEQHPGFGHGAGSAGSKARAPFDKVPDHVLLDLFSMPVVEPYAISEPFSTAGKINLNYQIVPFTNITRSTGLQAVLQSTRVVAIPTADSFQLVQPGKAWHYKAGSNAPAARPDYRLKIDLDETLKGFEDRFLADEHFRSASEICEMYLVPEGQTLENIAAWWRGSDADPTRTGYKLTGDNLRERPYSQIYSRLTTKSNTYTVHVRVQTLQQRRRSQPAEYAKWEEGKDRVLAEYRGSYGIERYLNPSITSYTAGEPLTDYKFRTFSTKQFTP